MCRDRSTLTTLKMATCVAETCRRSLCNKITFVKKNSSFVGLVNKFYAPKSCTEHGTYRTNVLYLNGNKKASNAGENALG